MNRLWIVLPVVLAAGGLAAFAAWHWRNTSYRTSDDGVYWLDIDGGDTANARATAT